MPEQPTGTPAMEPPKGAPSRTFALMLVDRTSGEVLDSTDDFTEVEWRELRHRAMFWTALCESLNPGQVR